MNIFDYIIDFMFDFSSIPSNKPWKAEKKYSGAPTPSETNSFTNWCIAVLRKVYYLGLLFVFYQNRSFKNNFLLTLLSIYGQLI